MQTTCLCSAPFPPFLHWNKKDSSGFISIEIHFLYHIVLPIVLSRNIFCVPNQAEKFRHSTQLHIYSNFFKFLQISANMISPTSPKLKQVSTINSDIRSGRALAKSAASNTPSSSLSNTRNNRSPNPPTKRYSTHDISSVPQLPEMSNEQVFDLMEKEQDKIVVKMTREISQLQEELKALRAQSSSRNRRSSSISSNASLEIPRGEAHTAATIRRSSSSSHTHQLPQAQLHELAQENAALKHENEALKREIESLKAQLR